MGRKYRQEEGKGQIVLRIICLSFLVGSLLGAVFASRLNPETYTELGGYLSGFLEQMSLEGLSKEGAFGACFLKYGKYLLGIWICGLLAPGAVFILLILAFRGVGYGFTTAVLVKQYGVRGIVLAVLSYLPQNLIFVPLYLAMAYISMSYLLNQFRSLPPKARLRREKEKNLIEYFIYAVGASLFLAIGCLVEISLVPALMRL